MRSPSRRPASLAGFSLPSTVARSEKATISAPAENILIPKGSPLTCTVRRSAATVRTVLTGTIPQSASVTLRLVSFCVLPTGAALAPCSCTVSHGMEASSNSPAV